jgi:ATP-binding cassette subfamily B protein
MSLASLYLRVLKLLGSEIRLGWFLAVANVALAAAQFAEPVLFGRIIDALAGVQNQTGATTWGNLLPLLLAWAGFGIFTIACGVVVALYADRLAHRQRHVVLTEYFDHVLQLPLSYHGGAHSGRLMKVMLTGTDSLWSIWLAFFREHFAAFVSLIILLPLSLFSSGIIPILPSAPPTRSAMSRWCRAMCG